MKTTITTVFLLIASVGAMAQSFNTNSPVIYEVNTRQYSEAGNFNAVTQNIPTLKKIGVDILWLMPVHPIGKENRKGSLGSYYSVQDYKGIDASYGGAAQLKQLIQTAHKNNMKVIIDWVANHTAWDHAWITEHPEWYVKDSAGNIATQYDWTDVAKLDYSNAEMRKAMIADMKYWVKEFGIDGFRCDVAFLVPRDFWEAARAELETVKPMYMLAEMEWNADITHEPNTYFNKAFNTSYGWNFMGVTQDMAKGKKTLADFRSEMKANYERFPQAMTKLFFITNHDENSWNGTIDEKYGNDWKLYATLCYTLPRSMPLIYSGEEVGLNRRLLFFEKDPITPKEWSDTSRYAWYKKVIELRHTNPALQNNNNGSNGIEEIQVADGADTSNVFAFARRAGKNEVIVITNFSNKDIVLSANFKLNREYKRLFDTKQFFQNGQKRWVIKAKQNIILYL